MLDPESFSLGPTISEFHSNFFHTDSELLFLSDAKMRGESERNIRKRSFILSLFFLGQNEMLQF